MSMSKKLLAIKKGGEEFLFFDCDTITEDELKALDEFLKYHQLNYAIQESHPDTDSKSHSSFNLSIKDIRIEIIEKVKKGF